MSFLHTGQLTSRGAIWRMLCAVGFVSDSYYRCLSEQKPYQVNMVIAGYDTQKGPELFYLDYLATLAKVPFVVHGYGSYLTLSVLDRDYRPDMTVDQAVNLLRSCAKEIQKRFIVNLDRYCVRLVTKDGISALPDLTNLSVVT
ncbi:hypothetical protein T265_10835 [Opisthorchis viverrini]|uniref:Proteasome subunit beta type-2 n=1 Tax=Opisthorchis viverrini TaxID=6198 RepID=A0A074ZZW7_OPIVI|nr:hypothetical protein T265_10835 [Opisthorchis viverrini]KER20679.1 hypothetical protein T265_10835 [Opisthorchis viverrini]